MEQDLLRTLFSDPRVVRISILLSTIRQKVSQLTEQWWRLPLIFFHGFLFTFRLIPHLYLLVGAPEWYNTTRNSSTFLSRKRYLIFCPLNSGKLACFILHLLSEVTELSGGTYWCYNLKSYFSQQTMVILQLNSAFHYYLISPLFLTFCRINVISGKRVNVVLFGSFWSEIFISCWSLSNKRYILCNTKLLHSIE